MRKTTSEILELDGHAVTVTNPGKPWFTRGATLSKLDVVRYYLAVADGALRGIRARPLMLKRYVDGAEHPPFYQKRAPAQRPEWLRTVTVAFPSGRTAEELVVDDRAGLAWLVNLGCIELHAHAVRAGDIDRPDELRIDLDPGPGVPWSGVQRVALEVKALLEEAGLRGWPKTSGSRGMHVYARIAPRWPFAEVRQAALALAREAERRLPKHATSKWWKEERHGVFLDYNQNARDRTTCAAYSVRAVPGAQVSAPLAWDEVPACEPGDFTVLTVPARFAKLGDPHAGIDEAPGSLERLLEWSARDQAAGLADAPWPPHFAKQSGEARRAPPSRTRQRMPLVVVARAARREDALTGLERWKRRHPKAAKLVREEDVLVDSMRGRSATWTRIRVNLRHVPAAMRPAPEPPDPDEPGD